MTEYHPDSVSPPGDTIRECMAEHGTNFFALQIVLQCSLKDTQRLLTGERPLTETDAYNLAEWFGVPESFWLERERLYRQSLGETVHD